MRRTAIDQHLGFAAAVAILVFGSTALGSDTKACAKAPACCAAKAQVEKASTPAAPAPVAMEPGMRAFLDPETGVVGPATDLTPVSDLQATELTPLAEPVLTRLPDGSVMVELNGHGQEYMILQVDADGARSVRCGQDPKAALSTPATAPKPEDR